MMSMFKQNGNVVLKFFIASFMALAFLANSPTNASAQLQIQIGGNEADFKARLAAEGYDRISTVKLGLSESKFDACKDGQRFRIKFEWTGKVDRKIIGDCRRTVDEAAIRTILRDRGFRRITIEDRAGKFLAIGCLQAERYRVEMNYYGDVTKERRIGRCEETLSPEDIISKLEETGYNRVIFIDRRLPRYVAEACLRRDRLELILDRTGEIRDSRKIGNCRDALLVSEIVTIMEEKGYSNITVIDDRLPRYMVQGCKNGAQMEVTLNRWGDISDEVRIGGCKDRMSVDEIEFAMKDNGYRNISVREEGRNFIARGCKDNRYEEIVLSRAGRLVDRKTLGNCNAPKINDLAETLRNRGLSKLQFFVEACENNRRVRISFDEFANRTANEVIGKC